MGWFQRFNYTRQNQQTNGPTQHQDKGHDQQISAAIDRLSDQVKAATEEEKSEDRSSSFRERVTIILVFLTFAAALGGDIIFYLTMRDARTTAAIQHNDTKAALTEDDRAWIGPTDASLDIKPDVSAPLTMMVAYSNAGRQPGISVNRYLDHKVLDVSAVNGRNPVPLQNAISQCLGLIPLQYGGVAWPTNGVGSFNIRARLDQSPIQDGIQAGNNVLVVLGCFSYVTFSDTKHTAYCYYYQPGISDITHLNICQGGNYAD